VTQSDSAATLNMIRFHYCHPTGFYNSGPNRTEFRKKLFRIRSWYPNCVDHCSQMYQIFFK